MNLNREAIAERRTWQYRVLQYTRGNRTKIGAFIVAMLGRKCNPPCFHTGGYKIKKDGRVIALYHGPGLHWRPETVWDTVEEMRDVFRGLASQCELSDAETQELFGELRKFIVRDERATSVLQ